MKRRIRNKKEYSCWTPRKIIPTMPLCTDKYFPNLPKEKHKTMCTTA
jgi:hypothetical protein